MCLIVIKEPGIEIPPEDIYNSYSHNPDGWGLMWAKEGKLRTLKGLGHIQHAMSYLDGLKDEKVYFHMRFATQGGVNLENAHPYPVLNFADHGVDLHMMHNGVLSNDLDFIDDRSDTWHLAAILTTCFAKNQGEPLFDRDFQEYLGNAVRGSKLVFLFGDGREVIINEQDGWRCKKTNLWYSNTYSLMPYRDYTEKKGDWVVEGGCYVFKPNSSSLKVPALGAPADEHRDFFADLDNRLNTEQAYEEVFGELGEDHYGGPYVDLVDKLGDLYMADIESLVANNPQEAVEMLMQARAKLWGPL